MSKNTKESKAMRDNMAGYNVASSVPVPELVSIVGDDVRQSFNSLENDDQRSGFLASIAGKIDSNWGNWAKFYEAVSILREQESFWRNLGFDTFEDFWHVKAGPSFQTFRELEDVYDFAKTACPEMFGLGFNDACKMANDKKEIRFLQPLSQHGGCHETKRSYTDITEAGSAIAQAMSWKDGGSKSVKYRLSKIKRDCPEVAAKVLAGDFYKSLGTGRIGLDMAAIERAAYGETRKAKPKANKPIPDVAGKIARSIRAEAESQQSRYKIIEKLKTIPWLVEGLKGK